MSLRSGVILLLVVALLMSGAEPARASSGSSGGKIVFSAWDPERELEPIYLIESDGSGLRAVTRGSAAIGSEWSRDGRLIAFIRSPDELWVMDEDGRNQRRIAVDARSDRGWAPARPSDGSDRFGWAPGGRRIVYSCRGTDICIVNILTARARILVADVGGNASPAWSPHGERIAFSASPGVLVTPDGAHHPNAMPDIHTIAPDGGRLRLTTFNPAVEYELGWSPDSTRIVFARDAETCDSDDANTATNIYVVRRSGNYEYPLTDDTAAHNTQPAWSPDGLRVVYARILDGECQLGDDSDIHLIRADGSGHRDLTDDLRSGQYSPSWSPDGRWILFVDGQNLVKITLWGQRDVIRRFDDLAPRRPVSRPE